MQYQKCINLSTHSLLLVWYGLNNTVGSMLCIYTKSRQATVKDIGISRVSLRIVSDNCWCMRTQKRVVSCATRGLEPHIQFVCTKAYLESPHIVIALVHLLFCGIANMFILDCRNRVHC